MIVICIVVCVFIYKTRKGILEEDLVISALEKLSFVSELIALSILQLLGR